MPMYTFHCLNCGREEEELRSISERDQPFTLDAECEESGGKCEWVRKLEFPHTNFELMVNGAQRGFAKDALEQAKMEEAALDIMDEKERDDVEWEAKKIMRIRPGERTLKNPDGSKKEIK